MGTFNSWSAPSFRIATLNDFGEILRVIEHATQSWRQLGGVRMLPGEWHIVVALLLRDKCGGQQ